MARLNLRLLCSVASTAAAASGRGAQQRTGGYQLHRYHHQHHQHSRCPALAFSWVYRGTSSSSSCYSAGESPTDGNAASSQRFQPHAVSAVRGGATPDTHLKPFATIEPSLLATIEALASDVDGTLTTPEVTVTDRTKDAIKAVIDSDVLFFPATGKTRAGMYKIMGEDVSSHLKAKNTPGVFIQGLVVYAGAGDEVVYERVLDVGVVSQVASFCEKQGVSLIAYSGDRIVCSTKDDQTDKIALYCEPMPEAVGPLAEAMAAGLKIHKLILMDTTENIDRVRPDVERLIGGEATFTQALPDMLEVLPPGTSKGKGVKVLLEHLGIEPPHLMALGDAENDVDMLRAAGVGVCVGNASPPARAAARFVALTNAQDGSALAIEQLLRSTPAAAGAAKE